MGEKILVSMADLKVTKSPNYLVTIGLGSCLGICLYDQHKKVAGLAHAMLPDSTQIFSNTNKSKFVDTAVEMLIKDMIKLGASKDRISAKLVGGAQMFAFKSINESMRIGDRNIEATINVLKSLGIPILAKDVGGNHGRTINFSADDGSVEIRTVGRGTKII